MSEQTIDLTPVLADGVLDAVRAHVDEELEREVGGILAGRLVEGRAHVDLAVPALRAEGHRTNVTFTHDVWEDVLAQLDRDHPELRIVGWYHSHPGFGIFLSEYDQFIQQNFFPAAGMVAFVVDPQTGASGWFATRDGATVRLGGDAPVAEPVDRPVSGPLAGTAPAATAQERTRGARTLLVSAALLVGFGGGWMVGQLPAPDPSEVPAAGSETRLQEAEELIAALDAELAITQQELDASERALSEAMADAAPADGVEVPTYRVRPGDTLSALARAFSEDPAYLATLIAANPHISDPDVLTIGSPLSIPPAADDEAGAP
jgi:proteasome lid subunit RPN8/RPN11/LysM repeat protein